MIRLECTTGGHNKFYELHLLKSPDAVTVKGFYGPIGQAGTEHMIYAGDNEQEALSQMQRKQLEKEKKGYRVVGREAAVLPPVRPQIHEVPVIWPMNAQGSNGPEHVEELLRNPDYIAQEKLDGMRAIIHFTAGGLRIFSRNAGVGDPERPLEKTSALPHLARVQIPQLKGTILDCEILVPGTDAASLAGLVNSKNGSDTVHAFVFDVIAFLGTDLTRRSLANRLTILRSLTPMLSSKFIHILPWAESTATKVSLHRQVMDSNAEGLMFKNLLAAYEQGARPCNNWFKFKKEATFDCVVTGFTKGAGKYNQFIGAVRFGQYVDGKLVELGQASGMTDDVRREMATNPRVYLGKVVTIKGQERLKSGAIRHPQYAGLNTAKSPLECVWYPGEQ